MVKFKRTFSSNSYFSMSILGYNYKLNTIYKKGNGIKIEKFNNEVIINLPKEYKDKNNEEIINLCMQKIYSEVAEVEVEYAMEFARHIFGFAPQDYNIKRLNKDYYKCTNKKLTINPDIVQFNKEIIYTTIIKAFCKIKYREGTKNYKELLEYGLKEYEELKNKDNKLWKMVS